MFMLNKVREHGGNTLYEVVDYDYEKPDVFVINTLNKDRFRRTFVLPDRDYYEQGGYLVSTAETSSIFTLSEGSVRITNVNKTLFSLLIKLMDADAYFIPESLFVKGVPLMGEGFSHFSNLRVSNSTMFMGFSLLVDDAWRSFSIMNVDSNGYLLINRFYIAVPKNRDLDFDLEYVDSLSVNNVMCDVYRYDDSLPVFPFYEPIEYMPLPIINHLFYYQNKFKNAVDFISTFLEESSVESGDSVSIPRTVTKAISLSPSVKPTSRTRRKYLLDRFLYSQQSFEEFCISESLNDFESFTFLLLTQLPPDRLLDEIHVVINSLRKKRNYFALLLMEMRCKIFISDLVLPPLYTSVIAQGGCSGFNTVLKRVTPN